MPATPPPPPPGATPFDTPRTPLPPHLVTRAWQSVALVLAPPVALAAILFIPGLSRVEAILPFVMGTSVVMALWGLGRGLTTWTRLVAATGWGTGGVFVAASAFFLGLFTSVSGLFVTMLTLGGFSRGRQLRRRGRAIFAPLQSTSHWVQGPRKAGPPAPDPIAHAWRVNGLTEHASVAAFARLAVDLVALGAPPALIRAAHQDAVEEMHHTQLCFSLARDLDGRDVGPAEFAAVSSLGQLRGPRTLRLARLAVESLIDGALNEGVSARAVAELCKEATDPRVQEVLRIIARDEARHAAHGFDVMRWCVQVGGAPVAAALKGALGRLPSGPSELPSETESLEMWGLVGADRLRRVYEETRGRLETRTQRLLAELSTANTARMQADVRVTTSSVT